MRRSQNAGAAAVVILAGPSACAMIWGPLHVGMRWQVNWYAWSYCRGMWYYGSCNWYQWQRPASATNAHAATPMLLLSLQLMWPVLLLLDPMTMIQLCTQLISSVAVVAAIAKLARAEFADISWAPQKAPASTGLAGICMPDSYMTSARECRMTSSCSAESGCP